MSTGFELLPWAIALAIGAASARRGTLANRPVWTLDTAMRDEAILAESLAAVGRDHGRTGTIRYGTVRGRALAFSWSEQGAFTAHVDGALAQQEGVDLVRQVEADYRRRVQSRTVTAVAKGAPGGGLDVVDQRREPDGTVVIQLQSRDRGGGVSVGVTPQGQVTGATHGFKGDACLPYEPLLESLAVSRTIRSWYTAEYDEQQQAGSYGYQQTRESESE